MFDTGRGGFAEAGACPASHPVRVPQIALEDVVADSGLWKGDVAKGWIAAFCLVLQ